MNERPPRTEVGRRRRSAGEADPPEELERGIPDAPDATPLGRRIGRFKLLEVLGQGGMGTVYLAEQVEPVSRQVAVKLMRSSLGTAAELARFEGEREALARLAHPTIAQIYEAGTVGESPWFAMELVRGEPITTFADQAPLALKDRLSLFVEACRGVQFAHQRGIIHRDLKPSNILVSASTGRPVVKIIDFGIAKALDRPLSSATLLTGHHIVGTPGYMSPETLNAGPGGEDVDTRSDVYALGVILYELLCGVRPYDDESLSFAAAVRIVTTEDAASPSQRLKSLDREKRARIAGFRRLDPEQLARRISGDLDAIARKATARERDERYESAAALAADIERTLRDEPILARPPSVSYRLRKFVRRHTAAVSLATLLGLAIVVAVVGIVVQSARARRSDEKAKAVAGFLKDTLYSADPWTSNPTGFTVRDMLDQALPRLRVELEDRPDVRAELLETIGSVYLHLGERKKAETIFRECVEINERLFGEDSIEAAIVLHELALTLPKNARSEVASMLRRVVAIRTRVRGRVNASTSRAIFDLADWVETDEERERLFRESLDIRERLSVDSIGFSLRGLGDFLTEKGRLEEAEPFLKRALAFSSQPNLERERAFYFLGRLRLRGERWAEAGSYFREGIAIAEKIQRPEDVRLADLNCGLGAALREQGRLEEAEKLLKGAVDVFRKSEKERPDVRTAWGLTELGRLSLRKGDIARARSELGEAVAIWNGMTPVSPYAAFALSGLGEAHRAAGDLAKAEELHRRALEIRVAALPPDSPELRRSREEHAAILELLRKK